MIDVLRSHRIPNRPSDDDPEMLTDHQLLRRFLAGHDQAFAEIVQRHAVLVFGVCQRILRQAQEAEDAFQATFLVLAKKARSLESHDSLAGWLHQTARRTSLKLRGMAVRRRAIEDQAGRAKLDNNSAQSRNPATQASVHELAVILDCEIAGLPDRFREVLLLSQVEGLTRDEVAQRLGISTPSVKDRLERGRDQLRSRLARRGVTLSATTLAAWLVSGTAQAGQFTSLAASTTQIAGPFATGTLTAGSIPAAATLANGMLKMMGYEKLRYLAACLVSFVTAGGIVFGMLHDEPTRFERGLRGQIVAVHAGQPSTITISLDDFGTLLNLDLSNQARVWTAYEPGEITDLKEGQFASLRLGNDHRTVTEIHIQGTMREVSIKSIAPSGKITIIENLDDDNPKGHQSEVELAPDAILRIGGLPAVRADLKPGMVVPFEFGRDGKVVNAIEADAAEESIVEGQLHNLLIAENRIILSNDADCDEGEEQPPIQRSFELTAETMVSLDGHSAKLSDLKHGSYIILRLADDGKSVRAVKSTSPEPEDPEEKNPNQDN